MRWPLLFMLILATALANEWDAYNFPNPTAGQFKECGMRTTANICDPDGVLSEQARYRLDHDLKRLETRTRQDYGRSFCDKKGVTAAMAVAKHVKGGTTEAVETMANDMLRKWTLDPQCKKAVVIVVSTDDMKFWVARDDKVPVYADEFTQIFMQQKSHFQQKNYQQALTNILQATWEKALSKQGSPRQPNRGGSGNQGPGGQGNFGGGGAKQPGSGFKMPSIPGWFWLFLIGIVIPLLCCCCCIYCCCCRGRGGGGGNNAQRLPTDPNQGGGGYPQPPPQQGGGGGGRGMFSNILSSGGGAAAGSLIGRFLSNRGRNDGGGGGMAMGGGNRGYGFQGSGDNNQGGNQGPVYDDNGGQGGGGLYPSQEVKDRGGGGSWA